MNIRTSKSFDDVLDEMLFAHGAPTAGAVAAWAARYPEHRAELVAFAAAWAQDEHLPEAGSNELRERSLASTAINQFRIAVASPASLAGLAAARGRSLSDVAQGLGIEVGVLAKLNARRITPASIGRAMASRIGGLLDVDPAAIIASWSGTAAPMAAAAFLGKNVSLPPETLRQALEKAGAAPTVIAEFEGD